MIWRNCHWEASSSLIIISSTRFEGNRHVTDWCDVFRFHPPRNWMRNLDQINSVVLFYTSFSEVTFRDKIEICAFKSGTSGRLEGRYRCVCLVVSRSVSKVKVVVICKIWFAIGICRGFVWYLYVYLVIFGRLRGTKISQLRNSLTSNAKICWLFRDFDLIFLFLSRVNGPHTCWVHLVAVTIQRNIWIT